MPTTLKYGIAYPSGTVAPNVPIVMQTQAESVEAALTAAALPNKSMVFKNAGYSWPAGLVVADAGPLTIDTSSTIASQMTSPTPAFCTGGSVTGSIKFLEAGSYVVHWITAPNFNPGAQGLRVEMYGTWPGSPSSVPQRMLGQGLKHDTTIYWENTVMTREFRVPVANLEVRLVGQQANATTIASQVFVTKLGSI